MKQFFTILIFFLLVCSGLIAQSNLEQARFFYEQGKFDKAIKQYELVGILTESEDLFKKGYCYYHIRDLQMAESTFLAAKRGNYETAEMYFLMGQMKQALHDYPQAIYFYKQSYKRVPSSEKALRKQVLRTLKNCAEAESLYFSKSKDIVQNLGPLVNGPTNESHILGSPGIDGLIYFSSNAAHFNEATSIYKDIDKDIYKGYIGWNKVDSLAAFERLLKSDLNDYVYDISNDGQHLIYVQGDAQKEIFKKNYDPTEVELISQKSFMDLLSDAEYSSFDIYQDSIYIFSSDMDGGYGGFDLYFTVRKNNQWLKPVNLGPRVNSEGDELSPFLSKQANTIYYSSNRAKGMGGFDVYKSSYSEIEKAWLKPKNLLHPINTSQNDLGFQISPTQHSIAYMYSDRLVNNYGSYDLYRVILDKADRSESLNELPLFVSHVLESNLADPIFVNAEEDIPIISEWDELNSESEDLRIVDPESEKRRIEQRKEFIKDSLAMEQRILEEKRIQDSLLIDKQIAEEAEQERQRLVREQFVKDSIATAERIAEEAEIERQRLVREQFVKDSIATAERIAEEAELERQRLVREQLVKDSIATAERIAEEAELERQRLVREQFVKDSIATAERIAEKAELERQRLVREQFVKDSIATAERIAEEAELERQRLVREQFVKDSIDAVRKFEREQFVKDSIEQAVAYEEKEALRIAREEKLELERQRLIKERARLDSIDLAERQEAELQAERHAQQDAKWRSKLEAQPLEFETIILSLGNPDATVIESQPEEVDKIIDILTPNPHAIVEIEGFYPKLGRSKVYDMYNSLQLANELKKELIDRNIDPKKLIVKAHGYRLNDNNLAIDDDDQRRILVRILNRNRSGYIPNLETLFSNQPASSNYYKKYAEPVSGLTFKVEAIKLRRMLANEAIDLFDDIILEQKGYEKNFAYMFGTFKTMNEAISLVDNLKGHNLKSPIIYPYLNGIRVTDEQAKFMEDLYPELKNYLKYLESL